jgi:hypothetical protein
VYKFEIRIRKMMMRGQQHSYTLSPYKIALCFMLYEAFQSPLLSHQKQEALLLYLQNQTKVTYPRDYLTTNILA